MAIDKEKLLASAQKHLARNSIDRALKDLGLILRDDPKDLRVRQKVAELLAKTGKLGEAMREFQVVAEAYERGGFYPKAAAIYKQMLRIEPDQMRWHLALGEIYQQLALLSDAMDHFNIVAQHSEKNGSAQERTDIYQKLLKLNPDSLEYAEKLADIYAKEGDVDAAWDVFRGQSQALEQRGDAESLVRVYEKMSALRPEDLGLVRSLADLYLDRGDPKRALAKLQICFKADPQDTETLNLLADAFVDLGEREKAVAVLKELAQIYESLGYEDYRNQVYDRIAEVDPNQGAELGGDSEIKEPAAGKVVEGLELSQAEEMPDGARRAIAEAEVYLQYGLLDKAQSMLVKAIAQHAGVFGLHRALLPILVGAGDMAAAHEHIGGMYEVAMDRADYAAAHLCLSRAVELDPDDEAARARLKAFEDAMGDFVTPKEPEEEEASEPEERDLGDAIELSARIAGSVADEMSPAAGPRRLDSDDGTDEMDFDDAEMQRLAAQLAREMKQKEAARQEAHGAARANHASGGHAGAGVGAAASAPSPAEQSPVRMPGARPPATGAQSDAGARASRAAIEQADEDLFGDASLEALARELRGEGLMGDGGGDGEAVEDATQRSGDAAGGADADDPFAGIDDVKTLGEIGAASEGVDMSELGDLGDLGELDDLLSSVGNDEPVRRMTTFDLAKSYYDTGMYEDAAIEFQRCVDEGERVPEALELLGLSMRRNRNFKGAVDAFRRLLQEAPTDTDQVLRVMFELGVTYEAAGSRHSAYKIYRKIVEKRRNFREGEVVNRVASLALELGIRE